MYLTLGGLLLGVPQVIYMNVYHILFGNSKNLTTIIMFIREIMNRYIFEYLKYSIVKLNPQQKQ